MANFECKVVKIEKKANHPNADRLTIYNIGGYNCISNKLEDGSDRYNVGDLVVYIPENAVLPEWLLKRMGFWDKEKGKGILAGKEGNRVKPLKLRGIYSEGVLYPAQTIKEHDEGLDGSVAEAYGYTKDSKFIFHDASEYVRFVEAVEGKDYAEFLEITKYEPPIPTTMGGEVFNGGTEIVVPYDVEPIQKYMDVFVDGEEVVFETKIHGTNCRWIFSQTETHNETFGQDKNIYIASKGQGDKGLFFKNNDKNINNYYCKSFIDNNIENKVKSSSYWKNGFDICIWSEVYGSGIQDLTYGMTNGQFTYAVFDVYVGRPRQGRFLNYDELKSFCNEIDLKMVDILYRGPYSYKKVVEYTDGFDTMGTNPMQIREGIVIKPLNERWSNEIGRVMVKSVSENYKLRKNATEYN